MATSWPLEAKKIITFTCCMHVVIQILFLIYSFNHIMHIFKINQLNRINQSINLFIDCQHDKMIIIIIIIDVTFQMSFLVQIHCVMHSEIKFDVKSMKNKHNFIMTKKKIVSTRINLLVLWMFDILIFFFCQNAQNAFLYVVGHIQ